MIKYVYISGWKEHGGAPGLGLHMLDTDTGELRFLKMINDSDSLNATAVDVERNLLFVDNETAVLPGEFTGGGGRIFCYRIDRETGELTPLNEVPTFCPNPAWPQLDPTGNYLIVANHSGFGTATKIVEQPEGGYGYELVYDDAAVELFRRNAGGTPGELIHVVKHDKRVPGRALHSHPHCFVPAPGKNFYVVTDKGEGAVYLYRINYETERLEQIGEPYALPGSSAPRYCVFHPTLPYFYVNQERNMAVCCFRYEEGGQIELLGSTGTLPEGFAQPEGVLFEQQGFLMHPNGKTVYSILNGPNAVAVLDVDEKSGLLHLRHTVPVDGVWPRGVALTKDGKWLLVSCLQSGDVLSYRVEVDGDLTPTGCRSVQKGGSYVTILE